MFPFFLCRSRVTKCIKLLLKRVLFYRVFTNIILCGGCGVKLLLLGLCLILFGG